MRELLQRRFKLLAVLTLAILALPNAAAAHCDTLSGPVVTDARAALATGDVTPVLKWIRPADEGEVRAAFAKAVAARAAGDAAREVADTWFFETLVRLHRAGEGAPFTGLKPAGTEVEPGVEAADRALDGGDIEPVVAALSTDLANGVGQRFARVAEARRHAGDSIAAGRAYVAAYVDYIHYVAGVRAALTTGSAHDAGATHDHGEE